MMRDPEILNARIESTHLGGDDHGGMTFWLHLDYGHSAQGFGGFGLGTNNGAPLVYLHLAVREILRATGAEKWESLAGTHIRAEVAGGLVTGIGHIIADRWFRPKEAFAPYADAEYRAEMIRLLARDANEVLDLLTEIKGTDFADDSWRARRLRERLAELAERGMKI